MTRNNRIAGKHLIVTVHGIRTFGQWQERLGALIKQKSPDATLTHYKYGYFSIFAFLIPPLRWFVTLKFRNRLMHEAESELWDRIDIVAHSFGTHLVAHGLKRVARQKRPSINTVILAGSVLKMNFNWTELVPSCVGRVVNECGHRDHVLLANQLFVLFTGMAGRVGFRGMFSENRFQNRFFPFGHSDYFRLNGEFDDRFMEDHWLHLLLDTSPIEQFPDTRTGFWHGPVAFLLNNAEPIKLALWITPLLLVIQFVVTQRDIAIEQRAIASSRLASTLIASGDAVLATNRYPNAFEMYAEAEAVLDKLHQPQSTLWQQFVTFVTGEPQRVEPYPHWTTDVAFWNLFRQWRPPIAQVTTGFSRIDIARFSNSAELAVVASDRDLILFDLLAGVRLRDLKDCVDIANWDDSNVAQGPFSVYFLGEQSRYWGDIAISLDGAYVALGSHDGTLLLCRTADAAIVWRTKQFQYPVSALSFGEQGGLLASGHRDGRLRAWQVRTGKQLMDVASHKGSIRSVKVSDESRLVVSLGGNSPDPSEDHTIETYQLPQRIPEQASAHIWDIEKGVRLASLDRSEFVSAAISIDERSNIITHGPEGSARWQMSQSDTDYQLAASDTEIGYEGFHNQTGVLSRRGTFIREALEEPAMASVDRQWDMEALTIRRLSFSNGASGNVVKLGGRVLPNTATSLRHGYFSPDESLFLGVDRETIYIWDLQNLHALPIDANFAYGKSNLDFSVDDRVALSIKDQITAVLSDVATNVVLQEFTHSGADLSAVGVDKLLAFAILADRDGWVEIYDIASGDMTDQFRASEDRVISMRLVEELPILLTVSESEGAKIWDLSKREIIGSHMCENSSMALSDISSDATSLVYACYDQGFFLVNRNTKKVVEMPRDGFPSSAAYSRNSQILSWADGAGIVRTLNLNSGVENRSSEQNKIGYIGGIGFLDGDEFLVTTDSADRSLTIWELDSLTPVRKFPRLHEGGMPLMVTPTGRRVITDGAYGQILFWDFTFATTLAKFFSETDRISKTIASAAVYAVLGDCNRAVSIYKRLQTADWETRIIEEMAKCYVRLKQWDSAEREFAKLADESDVPDQYPMLWQRRLRQFATEPE